MPAMPVSLLGDHHVCPMPAPSGGAHVGGPVINPGQVIVRVTGRPVAVIGGQCVCVGLPGPDPLVKGSAFVRITGKPVVRVTDSTAHGGQLVVGSPIVRAS